MSIHMLRLVVREFVFESTPKWANPPILGPPLFGGKLVCQLIWLGFSRGIVERLFLKECIAS